MKQDRVSPYIPETRKATKESLRDMLARRSMVYIKPSMGTDGFGIMKADAVKQGKRTVYRYTLHTTEVFEYKTFEGWYRSLSARMGKRTYVVQKGIRLLRYKRRTFDVRVMVQENERGRWEHTGTIGRVAHPKRIVTNYHNGGTPLPLEELLRPILPPNKRVALQKQLAALGVEVAESLQAAFPSVKEIGVQFGMDKARTPWIFEVNTRPDPYIFLKLKKRSVYRKIIRLSHFHRKLRAVRKKI